MRLLVGLFSLLSAGVVGDLVLRNGNPDHRISKRKDLDPQTCLDNFDIHRDKIIRTEDSRQMGAKYLNEVDLPSRDDCLRMCCETDTCDVFVFEEKSPGSCYMFHCGPPEDFKCKFTRHTNFSSAVLAINRNLAELEDQMKLSKHEQDLASLRKQVQVQVQEIPSTLKPVTVRPVVPETPLPTPNKPSHRCSRFQFECHSSEECIAIYNACDGIPQCADGSDEAPELGCPPLPTSAPAPQPPPNLPPREIIPPETPSLSQVPSMPQYIMPEKTQKEPIIPHPPPFMHPISSQDGASWPHHLDQIPNNPVQHIKQYSDNPSGSRFFNHKPGLQVTETDGAPVYQYDYKPLQYDGIQEPSWNHRNWPQPDDNVPNDGSPVYHIDVDSSWKQQQQQQQQQQNIMQNIPHRTPNNMENRISQQQLPVDTLSMNGPPNMYQDRNKMWAVPQIPQMPQQPSDIQPQYRQPQPQPIVPQIDTYPKQKVHTYHTNKKTVDKNDRPTEADSDTKNENLEQDSDKNKKEDNTNEDADNHSSGKSKKKHLKEEKEEKENISETPKPQTEHVHEQLIMGKMFEDDPHDGISERPAGAALLLTLGMCMTVIMVVLIVIRVKMARKRIRRAGKSPLAHDADYLVNGMYL